jgi:Ca2+/Na+ antiporter
METSIEYFQPVPLLLIILSCIVIWRSSHGFEVASDYLGRKLPPGVKGASLNAIASSMPEFLSTIFFLFYLKEGEGFSGGLGVTSGSALFNLLIIPSVVVLYVTGRDRKVMLKKQVLVREGLVLLLSQVLFVVFLFRGELVARHGLILVLIYISYLALLYIITRRKGITDPGFVTPEARKGRSLAARIISLDITHTILNGRDINARRAWSLLLVSTTVMTFGTWLLVYATDLYGKQTHIPLIFVAVVLSAAATSVPDTIISIRDARKGNYDDAVSNALGSNIFDIAFALGLPVLLYNIIYGDSILIPGEELAFAKEVWVFLVLATVLSILIMMAGKLFTRLKAILLLGIYLLFLLFVETQIETGLREGIGQDIADLLTSAANLIGSMFR